MSNEQAFREVPSKIDFVGLEKAILSFWQATNAFERLRELRSTSDKRWSFLDGPITANNPMGAHHAWGRTYKDLYQRFKAMQGYNQRWQNGFDCQGLWVEVNVEKALGFNSKREIESFGLANFTNECKAQVLHWSAEQTEQTIRLGNWMDWNDPEMLRRLRDLVRQDAGQTVTVEGADGPVTGTVEEIIGRLGSPELGGSYFTFSDENNYQIWGFLQQCFERGWIYKGRDVMPWCARCGTGISQHEIVTEGYFEVTHDSVYVRFPLVPPTGDSGGRPDDAPRKEALLVWTTTPWTLTSNVAAAVGPDLDYVKVLHHEDGWVYYLAKAAVETSLKGDYDILAELKGHELVGRHYAGPFDKLPAVEHAFAEEGYEHRVVAWHEVDAAEGTGIVHIAPGCGSEDFQLSRELGLPIVAPLDESGFYVAEFDWLTGRSVFDVAESIFDALRAKDLLYRKQRYLHRYPHCWRCGSELVYRLVDEWLIHTGPLYDKPRAEVTPAEKAASLRYQIMDVVDHVNWVPEFGYGRELDWLRNMHDWMISKKRYYGLALPIWVCEDPECGHFHVVGSKEELRERAIEGWAEFEGHSPHRPYVDAVRIACPECGGRASRIRDVGNPWLDAGIVAYSTLRFRSDRAYWEQWFPADFVTESFPGQFRNWFYSLLAQSTVLTNRAPFKNLFGYASLVGEDGREMHKSWGNAIEFNEAADSMGADTMRWLFARHRPEQNLWFGYKLGHETRRRFLIPLWNVYSFLVTYANLDGWSPAGGPAPTSSNAANAQLDRWIRARLQQTILQTTEHLEAFDAERATATLEAYLDDLSNWYVRRSRRRFWKSEADADKAAAYATLYEVLVPFVKLLAPFIPFTAEAIYQNLVRSADREAPLSVHHASWPVAGAEGLDQALLDKMRLAIDVASLGRSARSAADFKLRQPLAAARVHVTTRQQGEDLRELADVLTEEINVKQIEVVSEVGELVSYKLLPNNRLLGPRLGQHFPSVRRAIEALDAAAAADTLQREGALAVTADGQTIALTPDEVLIQTESKGGLAVASERGITVAVETTLTPELVQEGYARDLVRAINTLRKDAGLAIDDRVVVVYEAAGVAAEAFANFADYLRQETLSVSLDRGEPQQMPFWKAIDLEGEGVVVGFGRA